MAHILSIDPFNRESGPGIRVLIILSNKECNDISANDLLNEIRKYRHYIEQDNGGVTFSGNIKNNKKFLEDICILCHKSNIKTCIEIKTSEYNIIHSFLKYIDFLIIHNDNSNSIDIVIQSLDNRKIQYLIK